MNPPNHRAGWFPDRSIRTVGLSLLFVLFLSLGAIHALAEPGKGHGNGQARRGHGRPEWANGNGPTDKHTSPTPTPSSDVSRSTDAAPLPAPQSVPAPPTAEPADDPGTGRPGGAGTVQVDGQPVDQGRDNEPHVGCTFRIDFFGFKGSPAATYALELWSPTGSGPLLAGTTGLGPAAPPSRLNGSVPVELRTALAATGARPHPNQGFHVRLTVHAERSANAKHKTFWVRCALRPSPTPPTRVPTPPVMPSTFTPPAPLAFTGSDSVRWAAMAVVLLLLGSGLLWLGRDIGEEPSR